jgi:hypothetical protein
LDDNLSDGAVNDRRVHQRRIYLIFYSAGFLILLDWADEQRAVTAALGVPFGNVKVPESFSIVSCCTSCETHLCSST